MIFSSIRWLYAMAANNRLVQFHAGDESGPVAYAGSELLRLLTTPRDRIAGFLPLTLRADLRTMRRTCLFNIFLAA